jgi:hypothetical protein
VLARSCRLPNRHIRDPRRGAWGGGYPLFPLKETIVCRTVYRESSNKDLDFVALTAARRNRSPVAIGTSRRLPAWSKAAQYFSEFKILWSLIVLPGTRPSAHGAAPCGPRSLEALRGSLAVLFSVAVGPPAVLSKRLVFELIEDEKG